MSSSLSMSPVRKSVAPLVAFAFLLFGAVFLQNSVGSRQVLLLVVGAALGLTLYHAAFGFTSAWRVFINDRRGAGLRAQMVMLAVAVVLFFPALGAGTLFGQPVVGLVAPIGISVVFGAFIFGALVCTRFHRQELWRGSGFALESGRVRAHCRGDGAAGKGPAWQAGRGR